MKLTPLGKVIVVLALLVAAFFAGDKPKLRETKRTELLQHLTNDLTSRGFIPPDGPMEAAINELRKGPKGVLPFHCALEFPEVFLDRGGFAVPPTTRVDTE